MCRFVLFFVAILVCSNVFKVNSLALDGAVLTRYNPCGLGVIHFDRIKDNYWKGILNFGLYSDLVEVNTEIYFETPVDIYILPNQTSYVARRTTSSNLLVKHAQVLISDQFVFHIMVLGNSTNVPLLSKVMLNNMILCSEEIKSAYAVQTLDVSNNFEAHENTYDNICGRRSLEHTELISMRTEAKAGDWPWHVAILAKDPVKDIGVYDCGGNIISRTAVLTTGHCIYKNGELLAPNRIAVVAGTNDYKDVSQPGRQVYIAQKLILHPAFNENESTSDLGIIKVSAFRFTEYVQPICVWGPHYDKTVLFGKEATIVGFGFTENDAYAEVLRVTTTLVRDDATCITFNPVYTKLLNEYTFCAGFGPSRSENPRSGDVGGGIVVSALQPDHMVSWMLRGVLSRCVVTTTHKLCDPSYFVIYTNVGPHYGWINHHADLIQNSCE